MTSNCTCELLGSGGPAANGTACAELLKSCSRSSVPVAAGITLLLLLAVCALAGFGCWKHRDAAQRAFPRCLRGRGRRRRDYPKTLSLRPRAFGSKGKAPGVAPGRRPAAREAAPCDDYENVEVGPARAEQAGAGLYENARPAGSAEPGCGSEASPFYCNFQSPVSPEDPQDEDVYILPD